MANKDWDKSLNKWITNLEPYGISEKDLILKREEMSKKFQPWTDRDAILSLFNDAVAKTDASRLQGLYYLMSLFQNEQGDPAIAARRASAESDFAQYRSMHVKEVEVLAAPDSCEACKRLAGRKFTLDEVSSEHPLPCLECTRKLRKKDEKPFCRCIYLPVIETGIKSRN
jgi:hypothetical protein